MTREKRDLNRVWKKPIKDLTHAALIPTIDLVHKQGITKARCFWCDEPITTNDEKYVIGFHPGLPPERYHVDCIDGDVAKTFASRRGEDDRKEA